ncbi:TetR/AcrR family transcriptional regulator [Hazenella coriacea]|uniref:TetR family transcriptional regulator n=1 Tax=Hazenella coriacea TaxID=1179467 RepID=A0A4R3LC87_9BACL|nr:TetR/AcrR family transcriptional regulator [Hazenella coriacea]TCS96880.1 TetR family transcriptional regulator [Hazenella coriacea]
MSAARKVLAKKGLDATRVSEIVKEAGVSQGTFYLYFDSKNSIIKALTEEMMKNVLVDVRNQIRGIQTCEEELAKGIEAAFHQMSTYRDIFAILNNGCGIAVNPSDWGELFQPYYDLLELHIEKWQAAGQVDPSFDPSMIARVIVSVTEQAVEDCFIYRSELPVDAYIDNVTRFVIKALK